MTKNKILITCPPRANVHLAEEVKSLGFKVFSTDRMGVETSGTLKDTMKLNLHLRSGNRVLWLVESFNVVNPNQLYNKIKYIRWEKYMKPDGYFSIQSYVKNDYIRDTKYANLKVKDAIADRFVENHGQRPNSGPDLDRTVLFLHWKLDECSIYIDTSGETIAKHGYRKIPFKAPMLESLAAATINASKWDRNSNFINPMCGSGTLAIEAAMMAIDKAPGLLRDNYGFMHVEGYEPQVWEKLKEEARQKIKSTLPFKIIASDLSLEALRAAKLNAEKAGVSEFITYENCDFRKTEVPEDGGVVFLNPEYGERMGDEKELEGIYNEIGNFFKQSCSGYIGYVFTGNLNLAKKIGLRTKRKIEFFNGKIDCRLLEYELYQGTKQ